MPLGKRTREEYINKLVLENEINARLSNAFKDFFQEKEEEQIEFLLSLDAIKAESASKIINNLFKYDQKNNKNLTIKLYEKAPLVLKFLNTELLAELFKNNRNLYIAYLNTEHIFSIQDLVSCNIFFHHEIQSLGDLLMLESVSFAQLLQALRYLQSSKSVHSSFLKFDNSYKVNFLEKLLKILEILLVEQTYKNYDLNEKLKIVMFCLNLQPFEDLINEILKSNTEKLSINLNQFREILCNVTSLDLLIKFYLFNNIDEEQQAKLNWLTFIETIIMEWLHRNHEAWEPNSIKLLIDIKIESSEKLSNLNWNLLLHFYLKSINQQNSPNEEAYKAISLQIGNYIENAFKFGCILDNNLKNIYITNLKYLIIERRNEISQLDHIELEFLVKMMELPFNSDLASEILGVDLIADIKNNYFKDLVSSLVDNLMLQHVDSFARLMNQLTALMIADFNNLAEKFILIKNLLAVKLNKKIQDFVLANDFYQNIIFLEKLSLDCRRLFNLPTNIEYAKSTLTSLTRPDIEKAPNFNKVLDIILEPKDYKFYSDNDYHKMVEDILLELGLNRVDIFRKYILKKCSTKHSFGEKDEMILDKKINTINKKLELYRKRLGIFEAEIQLLNGYIELEKDDLIKAADYFAAVINTNSERLIAMEKSILDLAGFELGSMLFVGRLQINAQGFSIPTYLEDKRKRAVFALMHLENNELPEAVSLRNQAINLINGIDELQIPNQTMAKLTEQGLVYYHDVVASVRANDSLKNSLTAQNSIEIREHTKELLQDNSDLKQQIKQQHEVVRTLAHKVENLEATINKQSQQLESVLQQNQQLLSMMQQMMQHMQNLPNTALQQSQPHAANRYSFHNQPTAVNNVSIAQANANSVGNETEISNDSQSEHKHEQHQLNNII